MMENQKAKDIFKFENDRKHCFFGLFGKKWMKMKELR